MLPSLEDFSRAIVHFAKMGSPNRHVQFYVLLCVLMFVSQKDLILDMGAIVCLKELSRGCMLVMM